MPTSEKPDILLMLYQLGQRINSHGGAVGEGSMLERYKYFSENSEYGRDCSYARKCKDIFLRYDYEDIKSMFLSVLKQFRVIEGESFGK